MEAGARIEDAGARPHHPTDPAPERRLEPCGQGFLAEHEHGRVGEPRDVFPCLWGEVADKLTTEDDRDRAFQLVKSETFLQVVLVPLNCSGQETDVLQIKQGLAEGLDLRISLQLGCGAREPAGATRGIFLLAFTR